VRYNSVALFIRLVVGGS